MLDSLVIAYFRLGNWLLPELRRKPELARLPYRWTPASVHFDLGGGERLAYFAAGPGPETAAQKLMRRLWRLSPWLADFSGETADGAISGTNATYATARSTSTDFGTAGGYADVGQTVVTNYVVRRGFFKFDTHTIGAGSTVTQVNMKLVCVTDNSATDFDVQIVKQDWSAQDPIGTLNRQAAYSGCLSGTLDDAIWRNTNGMSANTQYSSGNLATAWVSKIGSTYYSLRSSRDAAGTTPTGFEYVNIAQQNHATAGYRPLLAVLYEAAATGNPYYAYAQQM